MRSVGTFAGGIWMRFRVELVGLLLCHGFKQLCAGCVEVDDWNIFFAGNSFCGAGVGRQVLNQFAVSISAPGKGSYNHRDCPGGSRLIDVAAHVSGISRVGVGLAFRAFAGHVIMSELNEDVVAVLSQRSLPNSLVIVAL